MSLLQRSFSGAVLIAAVVIIRAFAIHKLPKKTFLVLWWIALLRLLIPFSVPSGFSIYSLINRAADVSILSMEQTGEAAPVILQGQAAHLDSISRLSAGRASLFFVWPVVWGMGGILCAAFFVISYVRCRREFQTSLPVENISVKQWLQEHPLKRPVTVRQSDRIVSPLTYGILRPVILLPKKTDWENTRELQYILEHEAVHIRRYDIVTKLIAAAALCIHWFNPLVWVMYLLFNRDMELACDESVVRQFGEASKSAYARMLIEMEAKKGAVLPFCNNFSRNAIEERITAIMKIQKISKFSFVIAAGFIVCLTAAFTTSASNTNFTENEKAELAREAGLQTQTIDLASLQPGTHEEYGKYLFKKGDMVSVDINWSESGNVYFAIGKEFGSFRGLETSGEDSASFDTAIEVKEDGEYYIFLGVQSTEKDGVKEVKGEISYPMN